MAKNNIILVLVVAFGCLGLIEARLTLDNESELREAQAALFNVNSNTGWVLLDYVAPNAIHFSAGGEGDVDEFKHHLRNDQVQYAVIRLEIQGKRRASFRDVFIVWIGPQAETGSEKDGADDAAQFLQPFHSRVEVRNLDNFTRDTLLDRSAPESKNHVIQ